eukprot:TRINITY_DN3679_c0_g1_i3.p2 TRINITY_DN3679_c0_g1~~TRINITY_DN3679_c0_g1_i3.p2  ORF type:complete len:214 (-),score=49.83 TRINITY_DN3679_c0_g1_i3:938-1579(-)
MFGHAFGGQNYKPTLVNPPLIVPVKCTLNELYNGCSKKVAFARIVLNADGRTTREAQESRDLEIQPGYGVETEIKLNGQGNEAAGIPTSDLIFKIEEVPHPDYKRDKNNLIYKARITLLQALCAEPVTLTTLDSRKLYVSMDEVISPKTLKLVKGEGMPLLNNANHAVTNLNKPLQKGDLYIKFEIQFPTNLNEEKRDELRRILAPDDLQIEA